MISDFISINKKTSETPLYSQLYRELKAAIENGSIREGEKIPSIRKLCSDLGISKTTVETAYNMLCSDGYIVNQPKKGYFVEKGIRVNKRRAADSTDETADKRRYKYDFSGKGIDKNCSNIKEWRKYVKDILNKEYLLNTYGENQGEAALRGAIVKYAFATRGVSTDAQRVIVGSGSQTLIYILCGMLGVGRTVAMEKNFFPQAEQVFRDFDYRISYFENDSKGVSIESLNRIAPDILLINPNYNSLNGKPTRLSRKSELIDWAERNGCLIIEDDYNGELRYETHPSVCMQSRSPESTVYIGSFSKILLPSVRISYMALPDDLAKKYSAIKNNYNQTTSKIEQLALAEYINDGKLEKHLRKSRRYYRAKNETVRAIVEECFDSFIFNETAMFYEIKTSVGGIVEKCADAGIKLMQTSTDDVIRINFSHISEELLSKGLKKIREISVTHKKEKRAD